MATTIDPLDVDVEGVGWKCNQRGIEVQQTRNDYRGDRDQCPRTEDNSEPADNLDSSRQHPGDQQTADSGQGAGASGDLPGIEPFCEIWPDEFEIRDGTDIPGCNLHGSADQKLPDEKKGEHAPPAG